MQTKTPNDELGGASAVFFRTSQVIRVVTRWLVNLIIPNEQPDGEKHQNFELFILRFGPPSCGEECKVGGPESTELGLIVEDTALQSISH